MTPLFGCTDSGVSNGAGVAGIPRSFSYDPDSRVFPLALGSSLGGCDEEQGCSWTWNSDAEILQIRIPNQTAQIELTIAPNP